jgi:hypothetical protein
VAKTSFFMTIPITLDSPAPAPPKGNAITDCNQIS